MMPITNQPILELFIILFILVVINSIIQKKLNSIIPNRILFKEFLRQAKRLEKNDRKKAMTIRMKAAKLFARNALTMIIIPVAIIFFVLYPYKEYVSLLILIMIFIAVLISISLLKKAYRDIKMNVR